MDEKKRLNYVVGGNIQRERRRAGYTQEQLSEIIGVGPNTLSAIERGVIGTSLLTLTKICKALSVSSDALLFERDSE